MASGTNVSPKNENLFDIVEEAGKGKIALPQFQRSFVWEAGDILELLVSVFKHYFIGSLLLLDIDPDAPPFSIRAVEGSGILDSDLHSGASRLLLDGQQRITSLHYAFMAPNFQLDSTPIKPSVFFLDLEQYFHGEIDNSLSYKLRSSTKAEELIIGERQFETLVLPLNNVMNIANWTHWKSKYQIHLLDSGEGKLSEFIKGKQNIWDEKLYNLWKFQQPVLTLAKISPGDSKQLEEVCTIFEKLNSTGVSLSVFDLLTARLYPQNVNMDALWNKALDDCKLLEEFGADKARFGVFILRFIALIRKADVKSKALVNLVAAEFESDWEQAIRYFNEAYEWIALTAGGFGAFDKKWLPFTTVIPVLAALLHAREKLPAERKSMATKAIGWWYWASVFTRRYSGPVETMTQRDYSEMRDYFENNAAPIPDAFQVVYEEVLRPESNFSLRDAQRANSTLYRAVMCLLALNGACDWQKQDPLLLNQLEDHHIFPKSHLSKILTGSVLGLSGAKARNTIINRTLIFGGTNKIIGGRQPSKYLLDDKVISQNENEKRTILAKHFINDAALHAMESENYNAFLRAREAAIISRICELFDGMPRPHEA